MGDSNIMMMGLKKRREERKANKKVGYKKCDVEVEGAKCEALRAGLMGFPIKIK